MSLCARLIDTKNVTVNTLRHACGPVTIGFVYYFLIDSDRTKTLNVVGSLCLFLDILKVEKLKSIISVFSASLILSLSILHVQYITQELYTVYGVFEYYTY